MMKKKKKNPNFQKIDTGSILYCTKGLVVQDEITKYLEIEIKKGDKITVVQKAGNFCIVDTPARVFNPNNIYKSGTDKETNDLINKIFNCWTYKAQLNHDQINENFILEIEAKLNKLLEE